MHGPGVYGALDAKQHVLYLHQILQKVKKEELMQSMQVPAFTPQCAGTPGVLAADTISRSRFALKRYVLPICE